MTDTEAPPRVTATQPARALIAELTARHGPVMFHQSGGCCDGSAPMCFPRGEYVVGDADVLLGWIGDAPVYIHASQHRLWAHTRLIIDVVEGGGGMFSLDSGTGRRFLVRSQVIADPAEPRSGD
ncbi:DUF779 domain-containing protein [Paralimibaculum aggregatum]|uniref:DUF779 domain-containing protein n=1 Tax=Paralimibaculum aggregatum TaxID=3036245 RepID=A0ABQ6LNR4_9RHOB|nr:DUF779 domain-containing protein [Limibaculum sp. NKW23]GMG82448.1 DUF779 domain-containing protein [Limibaculum sp. NKW23]